MPEPSSIQKTLIQIGLSEKEAIVYEALLNLGKTSMNQILKKIPLKRGNTYDVLYDLINKGLVAETEERGKKVFQVEPPEKLNDLIKINLGVISRQKQILETTLPDLKSKFNLISGRPNVRFFEGIEGIKAIHQEILNEKKEILAYVLIDKKIDQPLEKFWDAYYKQRKENNIHVRSICPNNSDGIEYKKRDNEELRETRLVPKDKFHFSIEKNICGDKVALMSMKEKIGTIIQSKEIAETEREIFELAWEQGKKYN